MWSRRTVVRCVAAWVGLEIGFHFYTKERQKVLSAQFSHHPQHLLPSTMTRILECCTQHRWGAQEYREFFREWFLDAPLAEIHRDNVTEWLAYMLYNKAPNALDSAESTLLDGMVVELEKRAEYSFPIGYNTKLRAMRHSFDPIQALPLPLALYLLIAFLNNSAYLVLRALRFRRCEAGELYAWYRPLDGRQTQGQYYKEPEPFVFIGGLGIGLLPYVLFLAKLVQQTDRPAFLIEMPQVNLSLSNFIHPTGNVPTIEGVVSSFQNLLYSRGYKTASWIAHSYGTIYISWMLKHLPELVQGGAVFIDPVPLLLFEPDVIANMLYRNTVSGPVSALIRGELHVRYTVQRHFWWQKNMLFAEDLPEKTAVMLGATDNMIPAHKIYRYLNEICDHKRRPLCKMYNTRHGGVLWTWPMQDEIIRILNQWRWMDAIPSPSLPPVQVFHNYASENGPQDKPTAKAPTVPIQVTVGAEAMVGGKRAVGDADGLAVGVK